MSTKKSVVPPIDSLLGGATLTLFYLSLDFIQTYQTDLINIYINYVDYVKDSNKQLLCAKNYLLASIIFSIFSLLLIRAFIKLDITLVSFMLNYFNRSDSLYSSASTFALKSIVSSPYSDNFSSILEIGTLKNSLRLFTLFIL
ncbi:hypothetical protein T233_00978 [Vagococcus lutrae LBD1]|uniref:Uncharacterized protein n=1 Tax=Vagococcus lutrae LBD1 TaxID=1408226 RepID=V6Q608_9ENTE|nr:hypothetical protein T233_00978 [Vagococcus lutrae LBD1]